MEEKPSDHNCLQGLEDAMKCPICYDLMKAPVLLPSCDHNYCSLCIRKYFDRRESCPTCDKPASTNELRANRALEKTIEQFKKLRGQLRTLSLKNNMPMQQTQANTMQSEGHSSKQASSDGHSRKQAVSNGHFRKQAVSKAKELPHPERSSLSHGKEDTGQGQGHGPLSRLRKRPAPKAARTDAGSSEDDFDLRCDSDSDSDIQILSEDLSPSFTSPPAASFPLRHAVLSPSASLNLTDSLKRKNVQSKLFAPGDGSKTGVVPKENFAGKELAARKTSSRGLSPKGASPLAVLRGSNSAKKSSPSCSPKTVSSVLTSPSKGVAHCRSSSPSTGAEVEKVSCPVCGVPVVASAVNKHLDLCLGRRKIEDTMKEKKKPLPKVVYHLLPDRDVRKRLRDLGLPSKGSREVIIKRHHDFTQFYNADCDSLAPKCLTELVKEFEEAEKVQMNLTTTSDKSQSILRFTKTSKQEDIDKACREYEARHKNHFKSLIREARERMKAASSKAQTASPGPQTSSDKGSTSAAAAFSSSGSPSASSNCSSAATCAASSSPAPDDCSSGAISATSVDMNKDQLASDTDDNQDRTSGVSDDDDDNDGNGDLVVERTRGGENVNGNVVSVESSSDDDDDDVVDSDVDEVDSDICAFGMEVDEPDGDIVHAAHVKTTSATLTPISCGPESDNGGGGSSSNDDVDNVEVNTEELSASETTSTVSVLSRGQVSCIVSKNGSDDDLIDDGAFVEKSCEDSDSVSATTIQNEINVGSADVGGLGGEESLDMFDRIKDRAQVRGRGKRALQSAKPSWQDPEEADTPQSSSPPQATHNKPIVSPHTSSCAHRKPHKPNLNQTIIDRPTSPHISQASSTPHLKSNQSRNTPCSDSREQTLLSESNSCGTTTHSVPVSFEDEKDVNSEDVRSRPREEASCHNDVSAATSELSQTEMGEKNSYKNLEIENKDISSKMCDSGTNHESSASVPCSNSGAECFDLNLSGFEEEEDQLCCAENETEPTDSTLSKSTFNPHNSLSYNLNATSTIVQRTDASDLGKSTTNRAEEFNFSQTDASDIHTNNTENENEFNPPQSQVVSEHDAEAESEVQPLPVGNNTTEFNPSENVSEHEAETESEDAQSLGPNSKSLLKKTGSTDKLLFKKSVRFTGLRARLSDITGVKGDSKVDKLKADGSQAGVKKGKPLSGWYGDFVVPNRAEAAFLAKQGKVGGHRKRVGKNTAKATLSKGKKCTQVEGLLNPGGETAPLEDEENEFLDLKPMEGETDTLLALEALEPQEDFKEGTEPGEEKLLKQEGDEEALEPLGFEAVVGDVPLRKKDEPLHVETEVCHVPPATEKDSADLEEMTEITLSVPYEETQVDESIPISQLTSQPLKSERPIPKQKTVRKTARSVEDETESKTSSCQQQTCGATDDERKLLADSASNIVKHSEAKGSTFKEREGDSDCQHKAENCGLSVSGPKSHLPDSSGSSAAQEEPQVGESVLQQNSQEKSAENMSSEEPSKRKYKKRQLSKRTLQTVTEDTEKLEDMAHQNEMSAQEVATHPKSRSVRKRTNKSVSMDEQLLEVSEPRQMSKTRAKRRKTVHSCSSSSVGPEPDLQTRQTEALPERHPAGQDSNDEREQNLSIESLECAPKRQAGDDGGGETSLQPALQKPAPRRRKSKQSGSLVAVLSSLPQTDDTALKRGTFNHSSGLPSVPETFTDTEQATPQLTNSEHSSLQTVLEEQSDSEDFHPRKKLRSRKPRV